VMSGEENVSGNLLLRADYFSVLYKGIEGKLVGNFVLGGDCVR